METYWEGLLVIVSQDGSEGSERKAWKEESSRVSKYEGDQEGPQLFPNS